MRSASTVVTLPNLMVRHLPQLIACRCFVIGQHVCLSQGVWLASQAGTALTPGESDFDGTSAEGPTTVPDTIKSLTEVLSVPLALNL